MANVSLEAANHPFVLAIDVGSSSVRTLLYDGTGDQIRETETQIEYSLETTPDGGSTADAEMIVGLVVRCIDGAMAAVGDHAHHIAAVGVTTYWHALLGLDGHMIPTTPVLMWADTRSFQDARSLESRFPLSDVHQRTGCRFHSSYWPAKLCWLQRSDPDTFDRTARWVSFSDYLTWRFHGELATSISMASGTGLLGAASMVWDPEIVAMAGITAQHLPQLVDRDEPLPPLRDEWCARWPALADARWFPAIGDGATANVGATCVGSDRIALTIGTSGAMRIIVDDVQDAPVSPRLWRYRLDRHSVVIGGALSNGGNIMSWLANLTGERDVDALEAGAALMAPDTHGLTVLPLLAGERSPSWDDRFGGAIAGLRLDTSAVDLYRAFLESTAYRFASIYDGLLPLIAPDHDIYASGGAILRSPLRMQVLADTLGHRTFALHPDAEASARGAAVCALQAIGAIDSIRLDPGDDLRSFTPEPTHHRRYCAARTRLEQLERMLGGFADTMSASPHQE